jgi:hypothetical protein
MVRHRRCPSLHITFQGLLNPPGACGEAPSDGGFIQLPPASFDAYRVFLDICLLTGGERARYLKVNHLSETFGLELIESILTNHSNTFLTVCAAGIIYSDS